MILALNIALCAGVATIVYALSLKCRTRQCWRPVRDNHYRCPKCRQQM